MDKQNLETVTMGRGSSMPCLQEAHFLNTKKSLTVMLKRNEDKAVSY